VAARVVETNGQAAFVGHETDALDAGRDGSRGTDGPRGESQRHQRAHDLTPFPLSRPGIGMRAKALSFPGVSEKQTLDVRVAALWAFLSLAEPV
jgi:hypothetical protein